MYPKTVVLPPIIKLPAQLRRRTRKICNDIENT